MRFSEERYSWAAERCNPNAGDLQTQAKGTQAGGSLRLIWVVNLNFWAFCVRSMKQFSHWNIQVVWSQGSLKSFTGMNTISRIQKEITLTCWTMTRLQIVTSENPAWSLMTVQHSHLLKSMCTLKFRCLKAERKETLLTGGEPQCEIIDLA